jgi:hypothetical protein
MRRAALHLREHPDAPTDGLAPDDPLSRLMAELAIRAARERGSASALLGARLNLAILGVRREMSAARAEGRPVAPLITRERGLLDERNRAIEQELAESQPAS